MGTITINNEPNKELLSKLWYNLIWKDKVADVDTGLKIISVINKYYAALEEVPMFMPSFSINIIGQTKSKESIMQKLTKKAEEEKKIVASDDDMLVAYSYNRNSFCIVLSH